MHTFESKGLADTEFVKRHLCKIYLDSGKIITTAAIKNHVTVPTTWFLQKNEPCHTYRNGYYQLHQHECNYQRNQHQRENHLDWLCTHCESLSDEAKLAFDVWRASHLFFPHDFSIIFQYCRFYSNLNSEIYFNYLSTSASSLWSTSASESSVFLSTSTRLHCSFSCPRWTWSLQPIIEIRLQLMRNLFVVTRIC